MKKIKNLLSFYLLFTLALAYSDVLQGLFFLSSFFIIKGFNKKFNEDLIDYKKLLILSISSIFMGILIGSYAGFSLFPSVFNDIGLAKIAKNPSVEINAFFDSYFYIYSILSIIIFFIIFIYDFFDLRRLSLKLKDIIKLQMTVIFLLILASLAYIYMHNYFILFSMLALILITLSIFYLRRNKILVQYIYIRIIIKRALYFIALLGYIIFIKYSLYASVNMGIISNNSISKVLSAILVNSFLVIITLLSLRIKFLDLTTLIFSSYLKSRDKAEKVYFDFSFYYKKYTKKDLSKGIIFIILLITLIFIYFSINRFYIDTNFGHLVPKYENQNYKVDKNLKIDKENLKKIEKIQESSDIPFAKIPNKPFKLDKSHDRSNIEDYAITGAFYMVLSSKDLFRADFLNALDETLAFMESQPELRKSYSLLDLYTLDKDNKRLSIKKFAQKNGTWDDESARIFKQRVLDDTVIKNTLVSQDSTSFLFIFNCSEANEERIQELKDISKPLEEFGVKRSFTGTMILNERLYKYLSDDSILLIALCFLIILIVYYLSFRSLRAVFLPISLAIISLIWTIGTMSLLGYSLNVISLIIPSLILVLGSSYAIHYLNEYYMNINKENIVRVTSKRIRRIIILAALTTIINFLSLLFTGLNAFNEFGISASLGIFYCASLSLIFLPNSLALLKRPKQREQKQSNFRLYKKLYFFVSKAYIPILILALIVVFLYIKNFNKVSVDSDYLTYLPAKEDIVKDTKFLSREIGGVEAYYITLRSEEEGYFKNPEVLKQISEYEMALINEVNDITQVTSFASYLRFAQSKLENNNITRGLILALDRLLKPINSFFDISGKTYQLSIQHYDSQIQNASTITSSKRIEAAFINYMPLLPKKVTLSYSGTPSIFVQLSDLIIKGQNKALLIALILVFLLSILIFRSFYLALFSIIPVSIAIMLNYLLMYYANISLDMITITISSITVGIGIDDSIHFLLRFKKYFNVDKSLNSIQSTIIETTKPIVVTSISIILGMLMLLFSSFLPINYFGLLIAFALVSTTIGALLILPSCLIIYLKFVKKLKLYIT